MTNIQLGYTQVSCDYFSQMQSSYVILLSRSLTVKLSILIKINYRESAQAEILHCFVKTKQKRQKTCVISHLF